MMRLAVLLLFVSVATISTAQVTPQAEIDQNCFSTLLTKPGDTCQLNIVHFTICSKDASPYGSYERTLYALQKHTVAKPDSKFAINFHTDRRGSAAYNLDLTNRRALEMKEWFETRNLDVSNITFTGFGEQYILNGCIDGVACSEEEHQVNRRVEVIFVE